MIYMHENNYKNKIKINYPNSRKIGIGKEIEQFYMQVYKKYRNEIEQLDFQTEDIAVFKKATELMDEYLIKVEEFSDRMGISSQSKFRSTFIEEISTYLFKDIELVQKGIFGIYNKKIFAGMKINNKMHIDVIPKDVDFCIGKEVLIKIDDDTQKIKVIIPIVCVEAKTYLDATMFGEVQYSSQQIKNASPNAKTYVLMEYNDVAKEKIISARYDNNLNEMFVLRGGTRKENISKNPMNPEVLLDYYKEIKKAIESTKFEDTVITPGRLLKV